MPEFEVEDALVDVPVKGGAYKAYRAVPRGGGPQPGVIVIPDFRGLADHPNDIARRLAKAGYVALAVDLFSRSEPLADPNDMAALFDRMQKLSDRKAVEDLQAAERYLHGLSQVGARHVGVIGFCMGGLYALLLACASETLHAAVDFYGMLRYAQTTPEKPLSPVERTPGLRCPLLGLYGEEDELIPLAHVRELEERLGKEGKNFEIHTYAGCGHAFFNDTRPDAYRPVAARDAWEKTIRFFAENLRA
ncbi:MAG: dienelactone hydrolase family protein [Myxococcota bacterium]